MPLVGDLYVVSRPLTAYSGEVKAQIIARDPGSAPIALTPNFKMMITPSNYSGIGEDENYPDDPNIKNYYVKIDGKIQSMDELIALVQSKLDNGEFIGAQGPRGEKGDPGEKGEPGDVTEEYRNLASQIAQNASDAQSSATNAQVSATNAQKAFDDTKDFVNQAKTELNQIKTDTELLKEEANTSTVNAKASETKAKEYADNLQASTDDISQLKEGIGNKAPAIIEKASGKTIIINDSSNLPIRIWFAIDAGKTKVSQKIQANVKGYTNLLAPKEGLKYCFSVGENDEYEEYVEQVITAPVDSEQLKAIHTNYPTTVLTSENEISVEYVADTEEYIGKRIKEENQSLQKKFLKFKTL